MTLQDEEAVISLPELLEILPDLIADATRAAKPVPVPGAVTKTTGVVQTAGATTAEVQLDEDEPGVLSTVQLAAAVAPGDRVVVLLGDSGGAVVVGSGSAQVASGGGSGGPTPGTGDRVLADTFVPGDVHGSPEGSPNPIVADGSIDSLWLLAEEAPPVGQIAEVDCFLNGVSLYPNPADRPSLLAGETNKTVPLAVGAAIAAGNVVTWKVTIGSGRGLYMAAVGQ